MRGHSAAWPTIHRCYRCAQPVHRPDRGAYGSFPVNKLCGRPARGNSLVIQFLFDATRRNMQRATPQRRIALTENTPWRGISPSLGQRSAGDGTCTPIRGTHPSGRLRHSASSLSGGLGIVTLAWSDYCRKEMRDLILVTLKVFMSTPRKNGKSPIVVI